MARMMDSLILDNFGPFAFTKITTTQHHHHRLPRTSALKKTTSGSSVGSTSNLPQNGHSPGQQTMRINMHRNSTGTTINSNKGYGHTNGHGE